MDKKNLRLLLIVGGALVLAVAAGAGIWLHQKAASGGGILPGVGFNASDLWNNVRLRRGRRFWFLVSGFWFRVRLWFRCGSQKP